MRVRIKSFNLLPADADIDVAWAIDQCVTRRSLTQQEAYAQLKLRLAARAIEPPAFSSFNRLVVDFRENGIPPRYRGAASRDPMQDFVDLIDARIAKALEARFPKNSGDDV